MEKIVVNENTIRYKTNTNTYEVAYTDILKCVSVWKLGEKPNFEHFHADIVCQFDVSGINWKKDLEKLCGLVEEKITNGALK